MGAYSWEYTVPYEPDLQAALDRLRADVFRRQDYPWWWEGERPRPATIEELMEPEQFFNIGTGTVLDCWRIVETPPVTDQEWTSATYLGAVVPLTAAELREALGSERASEDDFHDLWMSVDITVPSWGGRCTVLYSSEGDPTQIGIWGFSGD